MGLVLYKIQATNGNYCYIPCVSYHLPTTDIRLISPQAYHQGFGGKSVLDGNSFKVHLAKHKNCDVRHVLDIPIDKGTNLPMVRSCVCTQKEKEEIGPLFCTLGLRQHYDGSFLDSWQPMMSEEGPSGEEITVGYDFSLYQHYLVDSPFLGPCVTTESNANLDPAQKEVLLWHFKLGVSCSQIQHMMKEHTIDGVIYPAVLPHVHPKAPFVSIPDCATCNIARAKVQKPDSFHGSTNASQQKALSRDKYMPGDLVSLDTVDAGYEGRSFAGRGASVGYRYVTIFHDAGSGVIKVYPQHSASAAETVMSKRKFEDFMWMMGGHVVKKYHSDQGIFTSSQFRSDCEDRFQTQTFSGVGAKFQNANAERSVLTLFWMCRTFLLHVGLRWSTDDADNPNLWPMALNHAEWLHNRLPKSGVGVSPLEILRGQRDDHRDLLRAHVFGAPCYVLDAKLQDGKKLPKFTRRARLGQFLGFSPEHSTTVGLIRSVNTGMISAQYHVVYDDKFETVFGISDASDETLCDKVQQIWGKLFRLGDSRDFYIEPEFDPVSNELVYDVPPLDEVWLTEEELREREDRMQGQLRRDRLRRERYKKEFLPAVPEPPPPQVRRTPLEGRRPTVRFQDDGDSNIMDVPAESVSPSSSEGDGKIGVQLGNQKESSDGLDRKADVGKDGVDIRSRLRKTRSSWKSKNQALSFWKSKTHTLSSFGITRHMQIPPQVKLQSSKRVRNYKAEKRRNEIGARQLRSMSFCDLPSVDELLESELGQYIDLATNSLDYRGTFSELVCNSIHPLFLAAKTGISKEDNPSWDEAMNGEDAADFWEAARVEIETLEAMDAWEVVDKPTDRKVLPSLWAFKKKRNPDGLIRKFKARFTARGDKQVEGVDFTDTWAPVVAWSTIRLMFIMQCVLGLESASADVSCAFLHGELEEGEEVYVEMPRGFRQEGKCLKLKKSLYGLRQAPRCFWKYLTSTMDKCGLKQSVHDPCMFVGEKVIAVAYVDDILFWSAKQTDIHDVMVQLRNEGLLLEKESSAAGFLGVDIKVLGADVEGKPTKLELTQTGLIDRIITNLGLDGKDSHLKWTPAITEPLTKNPDGEECQETFNYSAVVGQLLYLAGHTRPDIAYAVNCCARYMFCAKKSHEDALKRIGCYLKATRTKGMIITPNSNFLNIDAYPDADFAGLYGKEKADDPACVKSRTGFVILVGDCPVVWKSTLQSKTALSTMEAEITALAHCCKELFPIMELAQWLSDYFGLEPPVTSMNVTVHEDNSSALIFGNTVPPDYLPRSKFFHLEYVWFREQIVTRGIKLVKVETKEQLGDIFTKGLVKVAFEYLRKRLLGW